MLVVRDLTFGFSSDKKIINNLSFNSNGNNIIAVVGVSGSGKSTLLRLICGILPKKNSSFFQGKIEIEGHEPKEYVKSGQLGFMFQEASLFPNLDVHDNLLLPLKLMRLPQNGIEEMLSLIGLSKYRNFLPKQLSGGMKTRVALARTFITNPKLLLLDEPFSSLDIKWKFELYQELELLREKNKSTVVIVTHDIQEALLLSNHILILGKNGKVLKEIFVKKPLPRVFDSSVVTQLQAEYLEIQKQLVA